MIVKPAVLLFWLLLDLVKQMSFSTTENQHGSLKANNNCILGVKSSSFFLSFLEKMSFTCFLFFFFSSTNRIT